MRSIVELAKRFRKAVIRSEWDETLPLFHYYPSNCCEHSSVLLGYYLSLLLPDIKIELVLGSDTDSYHIWLEVEGLVYDLTLDQFEEFDLPIYGEDMHPFGNTYVEDKRVLFEDYIPYYFEKSMDSKRFSKALTLIIKNMSLVDTQAES